MIREIKKKILAVAMTLTMVVSLLPAVMITAKAAAPTVSGLPTDVTVTEDTASNVDLSAAAFSDTDGDLLIVTLAASAGTFTATSGGGVAVGGSGTGTLILGSFAANINTFLDTAANIKYRGAPNASGNNAATFTVHADDGTSNPLLGTVNITITAVNDAPVLDIFGTMTLTSVTEDSTGGAGDTVAAIIASAGGDRITDADSGAMEGIAVTSLTGDGDWQYKTGGVWISIGAVSAASALLLSPAASVRFVPTASNNNAQTATITFRAWDQTAGMQGNTADTSANGGTSAYSTATGTASIAVTAVNDAPVLDNSAAMTLTSVSAGSPGGAGDTVAVIIASAAGDRITDPDTGAVEGIAVTGLTGDGDWQYNTGGGWTAIGAVSGASALLLPASASVRFVPNASNPNAQTPTITFRAWDRTSGTQGNKVDTSTNGGTTAFSTATETASISVTANNNPTDISLSASSVNENVAGNTTVGTLSTTDPDAGNTFTYSLVAGAGSTDNAAFNISGSSLRITNSPDYEAKSSYSVRIRSTDQGSLWYEKAFTITIHDVNEAPVITTNAAISVTEGSTAAFTAAAVDPEGSAMTWSITGGADAAKFSIVAGTGVVTFGTAPSFSAPTDADTHNDYVVKITVSDGALTAAKTITVTVTQQVSWGGDQPSINPVVLVNGVRQDAGTTATTTIGGQTVTTITVDDAKLNKILESMGSNATVTLPTSGNPDVVVGELNGQTVKNMQEKAATLEIKTETVTYTLPASQINIDDMSAQLGSQVALRDIKVSVRIAEPPADTIRIVEDTANRNSYQLVVKPIEFEITCTSGDRTVAVSRFNGYVERTIAIPDGIDPSKITTGIVLNADGTFSHVPTQIVVIDGKYYAKINSLTNSIYSVIWNPVVFKDTANHWAKDAINDMGSRMIVTGTGNGMYEPYRSITRSEFAAIIVRALGLQKGTTESAFGDVTLTDWFNWYVDTATAYKLITGYDSASFGPKDTLTREQAMTILARAMKLTGLKAALTESEVTALLSGYTDGSAVSAYARESAAACLKTGVITGTTTVTISPKAPVSRAEVAVMVQRLLEKSGLI